MSNWNYLYIRGLMFKYGNRSLGIILGWKHGVASGCIEILTVLFVFWAHSLLDIFMAAYGQLA